MQTTQQTQQHTSQFSGMISPAELAASMKRLRAVFFLSQEQLADMARLSTRTIQRIERGEPSDVNTRRALARAFDFEDIDFYNKPFTPTGEELLIAEKLEFELTHVTLEVSLLDTGKTLARLVETMIMDMSVPTFEMSQEADEAFAALIDYFRHYRNFADDYSEVDKFAVYDELQRHIDGLKAMGVLLCYAIYHMEVKSSDDATSQPRKTKALIVAAYPQGEEKQFIKIPRDVTIGPYSCE